MTPQTVTTHRRSLDRAEGWLDSSRRQAQVALLLYAAIALAYFGVHVVPHLGRVCVCQPGATDPASYMWNLAWWPHALLNGLNPFWTNAVFVPNQVDLGSAPSFIPGAAILATPLTLLFGPIVTYNVLMLMSPVLAAFFAFLLCRYVSGSFPASVVGGYLFGFSTYMVGQLQGHLHLVLVFPIPAAVHLTLRLIDRRISQRRFIALMALAIAALLSFSTEVLFTSVLLGAVALGAAFILAPAARGRLAAAVKSILAAGTVAALVTSPIIYYALSGNVTSGFQNNGDLYGGDALGLLVPTPLTRLGRHYFAHLSATFTMGAFAEAGIYVGIPLALIVGRYTCTRWRLPSAKILTVMLAIVVVLLLGARLHIAGYPTIPLPWKVIDHSLLHQTIPVRLGLYMFLIVAVIVALWLSQPHVGRRLQAKWAAAALSIVFLLPSIGSDHWHARPPNPPFFTTHEYRSVLRRGDAVLVLPFAYTGFSMLWQAETDFWFRMAGGYLWRVPTPDYATDPLWPSLIGQAQPNPAVLRSFLARRHVRAVIIGPGAPTQWRGALAALGLKPQSLGGVLFYRV